MRLRMTTLVFSHNGGYGVGSPSFRQRMSETHQDFEAEKNIGNRYDLHIRPVGSFGSEGTIAMQPDPSPKAKRRELMMASVPMARDPVCGMMVDPLSAAGKYEHTGTTYYFCHPRCEERFRGDPEGYLSGKYTQSHGRCAGQAGDRIYLPDVSRRGVGETRGLSVLWHGA